MSESSLVVVITYMMWGLLFILSLTLLAIFLVVFTGERTPGKNRVAVIISYIVALLVLALPFVVPIILPLWFPDSLERVMHVERSAMCMDAQ
jgi:hypothetical protein